MPTTERISFPGPTRRISLGPHADSLCRPLEPGESVEVVNEGDRPAWLCVDAWTTRAALEATRQRDEAIGRAEAAEAEAGRLRAERADLLAALETLLVEVEPARYRWRVEIEEKCKAQKEWADEANARRAPGGEPWAFMTEFRGRLEAEMEPLSAAVRRANEVYDRLAAGLDATGEAEGGNGS